MSFEIWSDIAKEDFDLVEEFHCKDERQYLVGIIHFGKLKKAEWVNKKEVSVIVCPDGIVEDIGYEEVRKKSLELAGSKYVDRTKETMERLDI